MTASGDGPRHLPLFSRLPQTFCVVNDYLMLTSDLWADNLPALNGAIKMPDNGWSSQMLKDIDKDIPQKETKDTIDKFVKTIKQSYDPAPSAEAVAQERLSALLADVTTTTLDQLRELRDEIDNLMNAIRNRDELINKAFKEHVAYAQNAIKMKDIVKQSISKIVADFHNGIDPSPKTVTVNANG